MDIKQLKYFVTVANEGQITKAAQKLFMAQPPLSRHIIELEKEIGKPLFLRTKKGLELTSAGEALLQKAQDLIFQIENLKYYINDDIPENLSGILKIGSLISCTPKLTDYLKKFASFHPHVTYKIWEDTPNNLLDLLYKREIELLFLRTPTFNAGSLAVVPLAAEQFYLAVPAAMDSCPQRDYISLEEMAELPLIMLHDGKSIGYNELFINDFANLNIKPNIICQCSNSSLAIMLVFSGLGATIMPQQLLKHLPNKQTNIKRIEGVSSDTKPVVIFNPKQYISPMAKKLLEIMDVDVKLF
ncbi:LysR family transcriptional regulator [Cloacibacillus porcorum]|uniref:LysR family transcriptional regulator n=1 Tax=Cloacibacillus porcorum TaxID=1197717 RepID=UPI0014599925|nr:LysR family transcriptional regulator [Cloacibacillus porcorum]MCC8185454.1 LysR family transcriptional regulator [Cloacibacillus porcorum]MDY5391424.1 LysR family transcriptional regulator [Cloacibacillus porcorum]NMF17498.1 LysR family transcriptional regulator [Cloacibacillus porcorum]